MVFVQDWKDFPKALKHKLFLQLIVSLPSQKLNFYSNQSATTEGQTPHVIATSGSKKEKMHH